MKRLTIMVIACVLAASGCTRKPTPETEQQTEAQATAPVADAPTAEPEEMYDDAFIRHMHRHAERMDDLNLALANGDLDSARTPAFWLSRHDTVDGVQPEWQGFVTSMRSYARDVEEAPDLASAQLASLQITAQCQGCHDLAGLNEPENQVSN